MSNVWKVEDYVLNKAHSKEIDVEIKNRAIRVIEDFDLRASDVPEESLRAQRELIDYCQVVLTMFDTHGDLKDTIRVMPNALRFQVNYSKDAVLSVDEEDQIDPKRIRRQEPEASSSEDVLMIEEASEEPALALVPAETKDAEVSINGESQPPDPTLSPRSAANPALPCTNPRRWYGSTAADLAQFYKNAARFRQEFKVNEFESGVLIIDERRLSPTKMLVQLSEAFPRLTALNNGLTVKKLPKGGLKITTAYPAHLPAISAFLAKEHTSAKIHAPRSAANGDDRSVVAVRVPVHIETDDLLDQALPPAITVRRYDRQGEPTKAVRFTYHSIELRNEVLKLGFLTFNGRKFKVEKPSPKKSSICRTCKRPSCKNKAACTDLRCAYCGGDHVTKNCITQPEDGFQAEQIKCINCNAFGHFVYECPQNTRKQKKSNSKSVLRPTSNSTSSSYASAAKSGSSRAAGLQFKEPQRPPAVISADESAGLGLEEPSGPPVFIRPASPEIGSSSAFGTALKAPPAFASPLSSSMAPIGITMLAEVLIEHYELDDPDGLIRSKLVAKMLAYHPGSQPRAAPLLPKDLFAPSEPRQQLASSKATALETDDIEAVEELESKDSGPSTPPTASASAAATPSPDDMDISEESTSSSSSLPTAFSSPKPTSSKAKRRADAMVQCEKCLKEFKAKGIETHRKTCKGLSPSTKPKSPASKQPTIERILKKND
jgi:hypothetical protein